MKVFCKNIAYAFEDHPQYDEVKAFARDSVKEMYEENQRFEQEEAQQMLADGDIADLSEYDGDYTEPFDEKRYAVKITELTNQYMCNVADVPVSAVVEVSADKVKDVSDSELKEAIHKKYGIDVKSIQDYDKASSREEMAQQTYDSVGHMLESNDYQRFLALKDCMSNYSYNNIAMIYGQKPDAQIVKGFSAWSKELDRTIAKGEHAIKIWCPAMKVLKTEEQVDAFLEKNPTYGSKGYGINRTDEQTAQLKAKFMSEIEQKGSAQAVTGYRPGNVFDISQTESRDPEHDSLDEILGKKPLTGAIENRTAVTQAMCTAMGIKLTDMETSEEMYQKLYQYADEVLSTIPDSVVGIKNATPLIGDMHKLEALTAASLMCKHIGIDSDNRVTAAMTDILGSGKLTHETVTVGRRSMFETAFDRGSKLAAQFNKAFDKELGYDMEAIREAALKAAKEDSGKYVYFGKTKLLEADKWETQNTQYVIGHNEKTGAYFAKKTDLSSRKSTYILNADGKPERFADMPSREDIESRNEHVQSNTKKSKHTDKVNIELD